MTPKHDQDIPAEMISQRINKSIDTLTKPFIYQKDLLENLSEYSSFCKEKSICDLDSLIISKNLDKEFLREQITKGKKSKLVYRASDDGYTGKDYQRICQNKPNLLAII